MPQNAKKTAGAPQIIAVFGGTGSGKSTFLNHVTNGAFQAGEGLISTTKYVQAVTANVEGVSCCFVDTPGFDDTVRSDAEVLQEIATYLEARMREGQLFTGVLFLQRITDNRVGGQSVKNFRMFREMCGEHAMRHCVLVTTMWDRVDKQTGVQRETEMCADEMFWKPLIADGARTARHVNTRASAVAIVKELFHQEPVELRLQRELVTNELALTLTSAGRAVDEELRRLVDQHIAKIKDLEETLIEKRRKQSNALMIQQLNEDMQQEEELLKRRREDVERLRVYQRSPVKSAGTGASSKSGQSVTETSAADKKTTKGSGRGGQDSAVARERHQHDATHAADQRRTPGQNGQSDMAGFSGETTIRTTLINSQTTTVSEAAGYENVTSPTRARPTGASVASPPGNGHTPTRPDRDSTTTQVTRRAGTHHQSGQHSTQNATTHATHRQQSHGVSRSPSVDSSASFQTASDTESFTVVGPPSTPGSTKRASADRSTEHHARMTAVPCTVSTPPRLGPPPISTVQTHTGVRESVNEESATVFTTTTTHFESSEHAASAHEYSHDSYSTSDDDQLAHPTPADHRHPTPTSTPVKGAATRTHHSTSATASAARSDRSSQHHQASAAHASSHGSTTTSASAPPQQHPDSYWKGLATALTEVLPTALVDAMVVTNRK